ncbi:hypothetical protein THIOM_002243 [Candidatus Thiomargarita nelsonii]|uniref:Uncharacterized protein n=1 Tax=Candidatus Thiomargarita nelsonii TaxID=1003181 RepID=A0A176S206_9GAMM|nr:hypothetical protein THIOM_002243 [Candidatus Thiomargarita nelsonii]
MRGTHPTLAMVNGLLQPLPPHEHQVLVAKWLLLPLMAGNSHLAVNRPRFWWRFRQRHRW